MQDSQLLSEHQSLFKRLIYAESQIGSKIAFELFEASVQAESSDPAVQRQLSQLAHLTLEIAHEQHTPKTVEHELVLTGEQYYGRRPSCSYEHEPSIRTKDHYTTVSDPDLWLVCPVCDARWKNAS